MIPVIAARRRLLARGIEWSRVQGQTALAGGGSPATWSAANFGAEASGRLLIAYDRR